MESEERDAWAAKSGGERIAAFEAWAEARKLATARAVIWAMSRRSARPWPRRDDSDEELARAGEPDGSHRRQGPARRLRLARTAGLGGARVSAAGSDIERAKGDVKSEIARTLIDAMERGDTPWQRPWDARAMRPTNATTLNAYRGVNRILLSLAAADVGRRLGVDTIDSRWMTYRQAAEKGWQVRKGERGAGIVKLVEFGGPGDPSSVAVPEPSFEGGDARGGKRFALRRYVVFNAAQVDGVPAQEASPEPDMAPAERAEAIMQALKERTNLTILHGGDRACYVPSTDTVLLPNRADFRALPGTPGKDAAASKAFALWSVAMHEFCHSSMAKHRLDRAEAYAMEELTAQIGSAVLAAETGVPMSQDAAHLQAHASYLRGWIKAIESDPMAIFTAAKQADRIADYMAGLQREWSAARSNAGWVAEYDRCA